MKKYKTACVGWCAWILLLPVCTHAASGCEDLSQIAETANVDYETQIQTIWNSRCSGCHTGGGVSGGLKLDTGQSFGNLVGVQATSSSLKRVEPGEPGQSFLFQKINCAQPDSGSRMPPGGRLELNLQALVRDWIAQGAQAASTVNQPPVANDDVASTDFGQSVRVEVLANDSDPDGDSLVLDDVGTPAHGSARIEGRSIVYTPAFGFSGVDVFSYTVSDGQAVSGAQVSVTVAQPPFELNFGLSGSWFNPSTDGQGFVFEVVPEDQVLVVYWYTYTGTGQGGQQWLVGAGPYSGNRAIVDLQRPVGGVFDQPGGVDRENWGSVEVEFTSCTEGWFNYQSTVDQVAGEIPMVRITADPLCQALLEQGGN